VKGSASVRARPADEAAPAKKDPSTPSRRPSRRMPRRRGEFAKSLALQIGFLVVVLGLWEGLSDAHVIDPFWTSSPRAVAVSFGHLLTDHSVLSAMGQTLYETLVGFVIAVVSGIVLGVLLFMIPLLQRATMPFLILFNNIPRLVFAPLLVLYFGIGGLSKIVMVLSVVFIIVILNTLAGLKSADPDHLLLARALGASRTATFVKFMLPAAVPSLFVAMQLGLTFSLITAIVGEMITGGDGLGSLVQAYLNVYAMGNMFALILIMALLATLLSAIIRFAENRLLSWRRFDVNARAAASSPNISM
jgi:NitT/TauT family transport system permease protein